MIETHTKKQYNLKSYFLCFKASDLILGTEQSTYFKWTFSNFNYIMKTWKIIRNSCLVMCNLRRHFTLFDLIYIMKKYFSNVDLKYLLANFQNPTNLNVTETKNKCLLSQNFEELLGFVGLFVLFCFVKSISQYKKQF